MKHFVGVDVGGAKIVAGVLGRELAVVKTARRSTKAERGPEETARRIVRCIQDAVDEADLEMDDVAAVGVAVAGTISPDRRRVLCSRKLGWADVDLADRLEALVGLPVGVHNDGHLAVLGVQAVELGGLPRNLVGLFVGTGIRAGWMVDGDVPSVFVPEIENLGHLVLAPDGPSCDCGQRGCLEALASRGALLRRLQSGIAGGRESILAGILAEADRLRSRDLHRALLQGDELAREAVNEGARWIGMAVAALASNRPLDVLVLGGGILEELADSMAETIVASARLHGGSQLLLGTQIVVPSLGNLASLTGAAVLASRLPATAR